MLRPYFLTSSPPSSVSHSKKGTFTSPNDVNLIVCKRSKLEIFLLTENGIALKRQENLFACIVYMELFRPMGAHTDLLFLCTETYEYSILSWDIKKNDFILEMQGTFQEREGRPLTNGPFGFIDSKEGMIVLALYQGWLAVLPLDIATFTSFKTSAQYNFRDYHSASNSPTKMNKKKDFYNIRLQELNPLSIVLDHHERTSFAILYVDTDSKCY
ncbi:DNA damage-binding protein 1a, partial [Coelomomyces lativittatus]